MKTAFITCLLVALTFGRVEAFEFVQTQPKWPSTPASFSLGNAVHGLAINERYVLAAAPWAPNGSFLEAGMVQVFTGSTGKFSRLLKSPKPYAGENFGSSVALSGGLAFVAAYSPLADGKPGSVYVFNLSTGGLVKTIADPNGADTGGFGICMAIDGGRLAVTSAGSVSIFLLKDYSHVITKTMVGVASFGSSCAIEGDLMLVGAPQAFPNGGGGYDGGGYLYSLKEPDVPLLASYHPASDGRQYGRDCELHQGFVVLSSDISTNVYLIDPRRSGLQRGLTTGTGAVFGKSMTAANGVLAVASDSGPVYLFDLSSSSNLPSTSVDKPASASSDFGWSIALHSNRLAASDQQDDTLATNAGMIWLGRTIARPIPMSMIAAKSGPAPGTGAVFTSFLESYINAAGNVAFTATLGGPDSGSGTHTGLWHDMSGGLALAQRTNGVIGPYTIGSVSKPLLNRSNLGISFATLKGSGITAANNKLIMGSAALTTGGVTRTSEAAGLLTQKTIGQTSQSLAGGTICYFTKFNTANLTQDSALTLQSLDPSASPAHVQEGNSVDAFSVLGEIDSHFAHTGRGVLFSGAVVDGTTITNGGLYFRKTFSNASLVEIARKGFTGVPGPTGIQAASTYFSTFVSEAMDASEFGAFRATLKGSGVTGSTGEGLYRMKNDETASTPMLGNELLRKGTAIPELDGLKVARFTSFGAANTQVIAHVGLSGTGVTSATDGAVILCCNGAASPMSFYRHILLR